MTRHDFVLLDLSSRIELLWNEGEIIAEKQYYDCTITLFLLDKFYVEVFFNPEENVIRGIEVQESNQILYAYVSDLNLQELTRLLQR